jgi:hypothetical protein
MTAAVNLPTDRLMQLETSAPQLMKNAADAIKRYEDLWKAEDWSGLTQHANGLAGQAETFNHHLARHGALADLTRERLGVKEKFVAEAFAAVAGAKGEVAEDAREALLSLFKGKLGNLKAAKAAVDKLSDGTGPLFDQAKRFASLVDNHEEQMIDAIARLRTLAMVGQFFGLLRQSARVTSEYNDQLTKRLKGFTGLQLEDGDVELVTSLGAQLRNRVQTGFASMFRLLQKEQPAERLAEVAAGFSRQNVWLSGHVGAVLGSYLAIARATANGKQRGIQQGVALDTTDWLKRLTLFLAYCSYVEGNCVGRDVKRWYRDETERVKSRSVESEVPRGAKKQIPKLIDNNQIESGAFVQVQGLVTAVAIKVDPAPPKFSTIMEIEDIESSSQIRIRAHMRSLIANGVGEGVYCRVNGFVRRDESWLKDRPIGIDLDRISLTELRKTSWSDDVTFRMKGYYTLFPDEMNMVFTPRLLM